MTILVESLLLPASLARSLWCIVVAVGNVQVLSVD